MSIGLVFNVYQDAAALRGMLEASLPFFDDAFAIHAGPNNKRSTDGTIELLEEFGIRHRFADVMLGFGVIRTRLIHESKCDWSFIMDADERFYPEVSLMEVSGTDKYPYSMDPQCPCKITGRHHQGNDLRSRLSGASSDVYAFRMCRRHWMNAPGEVPRPAQNWKEIPDWQLRCVRNDPKVFFLPERKMHEHLKFSPTWEEPRWISGDQEKGSFYDHFHVHFKTIQPEKNAEDMATYKAMDENLTKGMWLESAPGVKV